MLTEFNSTNSGYKDSLDVPIDMEFDHYLFEVFLNDRIENEILRMMGNSLDFASDHKPPMKITTPKTI